MQDLFTLTNVNGLILNSKLTIGNSSEHCPSEQVLFVGSQSLTGTGEVVFNDSSGVPCGGLFPADGSTLTIGAGITIHGLFGIVGHGAGAIMNYGQIISDYANGAINLVGNFTNSGC